MLSGAVEECRVRITAVEAEQQQWRQELRQNLHAVLTEAKKSSVTAENYETVEAAYQTAQVGKVLHGEIVALSVQSDESMQEALTWRKKKDVEEPKAIVVWLKACFSANRRDLLRVKTLLDEAGATTPEDLTDLFGSGEEGVECITRWSKLYRSSKDGS